MAEQKTKPTAVGVGSFLDGIGDEAHLGVLEELVRRSVDSLRAGEKKRSTS